MNILYNKMFLMDAYDYGQELLYSKILINSIYK